MSETLRCSSVITSRDLLVMAIERKARWSVHTETKVCRVVIGQCEVNLIAGSVDEETQIRHARHSVGPFEWSATKPAVSAVLDPQGASPRAGRPFRLDL